MSAVVVTDLTAQYGTSVVLESLNLSVKDGEFVVLVGPSGCGKSTLLNCVAGLHDITSGQVFIGDKNVTWEEPKNRGIGMVFQSYALYPQMSVEKNLSFGLRVSGLSKSELRSRVNRIAETLQIQELLKRNPNTLSGGQKQRVAIGRALVRDANVFLLDEPLSSLDAKLRTDLRIELKQLHRRLDKTTMYVTHDQVEALTLADRVAVMNHGVIQQYDTPAIIYKQPVNRFVADFMGSTRMNFVRGVLQEGDAGSWTMLAEGAEIALDGYEFSQQAIAGQEIELGIRAEHFILGEFAHSQPIVLQVQVDIVESMGADTLIWAQFGQSSVSIRTDADTNIAANDTITAGFDPAKVSLFASDGTRL